MRIIDRLKQLDKVEILGYFVILFCAFLIYPCFFSMGVFPLGAENYFWSSLDPSWSLALSYANENNFVWGKDIAFTYGPLGYLSTRIGWGINRNILLLFDVFYFLNFIYIFYYTFKNALNKIVALLIIVAVTLTIPYFLGGGIALILFMFLIFWLKLSIDKPKIIYFLIQTIFIVLLFFIKFNTGLISFGLFYIGLTYLFIFKKYQRERLVILALFPIILVLFLCYPLNVSLFEYIISGFYIVTGYNEIMHIDDPVHESYLITAVIFILLSVTFLIVKYFKDKVNFFRNLVVLGFFSICIYVLYKQAFVRADLGHILEFFKYALLVLLCINEFTSFKNRNALNLFPIILIGIVFFINFKNKEITSEKLSQRFSKKEYVNDYKLFVLTNGNFNLHPNTNNFSPEIKAKIKDKTVDVFPWNIHMILENKLNYKPRPVIQSYSAYNKYLEDLNFNYYNSEKAPEFVFYDYESIDGRYPLFDEAKVSLVLSKNYQISDTLTHNNRKMLLLEKKANAKPLKFVKINEYAMLLDSPLIPAEGLFYEVNLFNTFGGKVKSILRFTPEINLEIVTKEKVTTHRTSKALLEAGIFSNLAVRNVSDFAKLIEPNRISKETDFPIKAYYFRPKKMSLFGDKIKIVEYKITQ